MGGGSVGSGLASGKTVGPAVMVAGIAVTVDSLVAVDAIVTAGMVAVASLELVKLAPPRQATNSKLNQISRCKCRIDR